jgi:hypothetical protein
MATDAQQSGPLPGQTFTLGRWRQTFGHDPAIVGDTDGSAFGLTLPPSTDIAEVGSLTVESVAIVGGHPLIIPLGESQSIEIPASTNPTVGRTDIIAAKWDPATFNTSPGPVRLVRIAGTEGSANLPAYAPPLVRPFWAVTRKQGQALNQATKRDLRVWSGRHYLVKAGEALPTNAPLGSTATRAGIKWRVDFVDTAVDWVQETNLRTVLAGTNIATTGDDWVVRPAARLSRDGVERWANIVVGLAGSPVNPNQEVDGERRVARLLGADRPPTSVPLTGFAQNTAGITRAAQGRIDPDGWVVWYWTNTSGRFPTGSTVALSGAWELNA